MLTHHIQHDIVSRLVAADSLSFSQLKNPLIDNKLFTYHLKLTVKAGFVEKMTDGSYRLTNQGRKLWKRAKESPEAISKRALSVLYLAVFHPLHGWLYYQRHTHPLKDRKGFMHITPRHDTSITDLAEQELLHRTGLRAKFSIAGSGFFRVYQDDLLESYVNFTLLLCETAEGTLQPNDDFAEYFWINDLTAPSPELLPNMRSLVKALLARDFPFFIDESIQAT